MAELPQPCPCGHPTAVNDEAWEIPAAQADGTCAEAAEKANDGAGRPGVRCKCHDAQGRLILKEGK